MIAKGHFYHNGAWIHSQEFEMQIISHIVLPLSVLLKF